MEIKMIGVYIDSDCRQHFCGAEDFFAKNQKTGEISIGEKVLVETNGFIELGTVKTSSVMKTYDENSPELKKIIGIAGESELNKIKELNKKSRALLPKIKQIAKKYSDDMKVVSANYSYDEQKLLIRYISENRVDFREIVKELATEFRIRIEMKQIGDRDEAKCVGGLGMCGKECCCKQYLKDFVSVSIKMAKNQDLSLNPAKISGICGRLLCCLSFENNYYAETLKIMPSVGETVETPEGRGEVVYNDLLKRIVSVKIHSEKDTDEIKEFELEKIKRKSGQADKK